ncbi:hypothetical protein D3C78_765140 [compost metagenome]
MGHQDVGDRHGGHVGALAVVGAGRDHAGLVGRAADLFHHFGGNRHEGHRHGGGQVADRRHAQARGLQGGVQLAVLDQLHRLGEGHELDATHVLVGEPGGLEDGPRVQLGTGLGGADRDALALEVGQGLDAGVGAGDDLDVVRIGAGDGAQLGQRRLEAGVLDALPGIIYRVGQREAQLAATGLQQVEVLHRGLGGLHRGLRTFDAVAVQLRQAHTDRVVHPAGAAGEDVDEGRRGENRGAGSQGRGSGEQAQALAQFHGDFSVFL